jgi:hypothetical protein
VVVLAQTDGADGLRARYMLALLYLHHLLLLRDVCGDAGSG